MKTEFNYTLVGDVHIPNLISTKTNYQISFWGQRHREYLKQNHKVIYYNLLTSDKLNSYLHDVDVRATEMYNNLVKQLAEKENVTEKLKTTNQMLWVQMMNNITNQAREDFYYKLIF